MSATKSTKSTETFIMKPKVDFCFKELMSDEEIRRGFISALLGVKPEEIVHTELLPTHLRKTHQGDKLGIHIMELPKLEKRAFPKTDLWNWAQFFHAENKEEFEVAAKTDPYITKAYEKLVHLSADEEKRLEYEAREKAIRDYNWQMKSNWRSGHEEGIKEGIKEGIRVLIHTLQDYSIPKEKVVHKIVEAYSLTEAEAEEYIREYWKD